MMKEHDLDHFISGLRRPSREYTPIPFWFLNGDLRHNEIKRQLRDFSDHGVYGVVLHPRMGLSRRIGYLSPLFFSYLRTAVETASELDMKIVLYDEGMYPSGSAGGMIVENDPDLASRGITVTGAPLPHDRILCRTKDGCLVERFSGGTIRGLHYGEDDGEKGAPRSADILAPEAVDAFIRLTHEAYYREFSEYFGSTVIGFFTDEPSVLGRNTTGLMPWTKDFDRIFLREGGHLEGLLDLFSGKENPDTVLYHRLIRRRENEVYYGRLSKWCDLHGIALMGHPHQSYDIEPLRYFHIPGQDLVFRWVSPEKGGTVGMDSVMAKCGADMAFWLGRKRSCNECFGACNRDNNPWYFTGADMKWYIDYLAVRGVDLFIPHAFYYSLKGKRSAERPPDVGPGNIWWPHYRKWSAYMSRLSCLMAESETVCAIAVPCRDRSLRADEVRPLFESQRSFRYLPESLWEECREEGGRLICRGKVFDAVLDLEGLFPTVFRDISRVPPVCTCLAPQEFLRAAHLRFRGRDAWLLVNENQTGPIDTDVLFSTAYSLGRYDLWLDRVTRLFSREEGGSRRVSLHLDPNESVLLFSCVSTQEWESLPVEAAAALTLRNEDLTLTDDDCTRSVKTYTAHVLSCKGDLRVLLNASEMVEVYVGEKLMGTAFWAPQDIIIPGRDLPKGPFTVRVAVTGSRANRYGRPVYYGLDASEG